MSPRTTFSSIAVPDFNIHLDPEMDQSRMQQSSRMPSQSVPTTNHNSPTHTSTVPKLNLSQAQHHVERPLVKSKSMPGTSRELPQPTKFTFSTHDVTTMSKMTDNTSQIPHWREFPKPPIRILCRVELKAKLKLDTYKATSHAQQQISPQYHKSSHIPMKSHSVFEPSPEQQYYQSYYSQQHGYDSQDESEEEDEDEEYDETSSEEEDGDENRPENYAYTYHAPMQQSQQPSSKHFTFPTQSQQQLSSQHQYVPRPQQPNYDYQKPTPARMVPQSRPSMMVEEKKRIINRSPVKSVPMKPTPSTSSASQVVFTIHPHHHKYSQPDQKRASFSQPTPAPLPQHQRQRSESSLQQHIRRHRSAPSIESTPPKHLIRKPTPQYHDYQYDQVQQSASAYELARTLWRKQRRSYQDMLTTLHSKLHISGSPPYPSHVPQFVSP